MCGFRLNTVALRPAKQDLNLVNIKVNRRLAFFLQMRVALLKTQLLTQLKYSRLPNHKNLTGRYSLLLRLLPQGIFWQCLRVLS